MFQKHGHYEFDSARTYTGGTSEEYLGKIDWKSRGLVMDTKLYPNAVRTVRLKLWCQMIFTPHIALLIRLDWAWQQSNARLRAPGKTVISHSPEVRINQSAVLTPGLFLTSVHERRICGSTLTSPSKPFKLSVYPLVYDLIAGGSCVLLNQLDRHVVPPRA